MNAVTAELSVDAGFKAFWSTGHDVRSGTGQGIFKFPCNVADVFNLDI